MRYESEMIGPLIAYLDKKGYAVAVEWRTSFAVPDLIAAKPDPKRVADRISAGQYVALSKELHWRVLCRLPGEGLNEGLDVGELAGELGLSASYLRNTVLRDLARNNYVALCENKCWQNNGFHPYASELLTIEAKVRDWKRAGAQCLRHQTFTNRAYVALPECNIGAALRHIETFKQANVGLLEVAENGSVISHFEPEFRQPREEALYYLALEHLWPKAAHNALTRDRHE